MSTHQILDQVLQLAPEERIQLIEDAWASLAATPESVPVPNWHRTLLDERLADPNEVGSRTWEEVKAAARRQAP